MSVYRLATANTYDRALFNIQQRQSQLGVSQEQLSSGKRVLRASDDAVAATLSERTQNRLSRTEADLRALEASRRSLAQAESTLGSVSELYGRVKELMVQAGDGVLNASDKASISNELKGIREQLVGFANQKDTAGSPLFAGLGTTDAQGSAFGGSPSVTWYGMDGQYAATPTSLPRSIDGSLVFGRNAAAPNINVWETLDKVITALDTNAAGLTGVLDTAHSEMAVREDSLLLARGKLGDWLNRADNMENLFEGRTVAYEKENSELVDVDMLKAVTDFKMNETAYQAALQSYSQVQKMSMFDYMR